MTTLLESLKTSPELPNLLDEMNAFFQDERQKRQQRQEGYSQRAGYRQDGQERLQ